MDVLHAGRVTNYVLCIPLQAYAERIAALDKAFAASLINSEQWVPGAVPVMQSRAEHCLVP